MAGLGDTVAELLSRSRAAALKAENGEAQLRRVIDFGSNPGALRMAAVMLATYPEVFAAGALIAGLPYGAASGVS